MASLTSSAIVMCQDQASVAEGFSMISEKPTLVWRARRDVLR